MKAEWVGRWAGRTVVCIASGPSLTEGDCAAAKASGHPAIVTNTTFRLCPWADVLMAYDGKWWKEYQKEVEATFTGERLTCSSAGAVYGAKSLLYQSWFTTFGNSGASAIGLAIAAGARRVVLIGYDCQRTGGKTHWHGDHPKALGNARSLANWPKHFKAVSKYANEKGVQVINASRATALTCFDRAELEQAMA